MTEIKYLPNAIREHLLAQNETSVLLWDLLVAADLREFTVEDALEKCRELVAVSVYRMYSGLAALKRLGVVAVKLIKQNRGRPVQVFRLTPVNLVLERWNLRQGASDAVPPSEMASPKRYRAALHRAFIKRVRPDWSRKNLGGRLGVSGRATYNYEQMYKDIKVTPRYEELEVVRELSFGLDEIELEKLPEKLSKGRPCYLRVYDEVALTDAELIQQQEKVLVYNRDIRPGLHFRMQMFTTKQVERRFPAVRYMAERLLAKGYRVSRVRRLANLYEVVDEPIH